MPGFMPFVGVQFIARNVAMIETVAARTNSLQKSIARNVTTSADAWNRNARYFGMVGAAAGMLGGMLVAVTGVLASATMEYERAAAANIGLAQSMGVPLAEAEAFTEALRAQAFTRTTALKTANSLMAAEMSLTKLTHLGAIANDIATARTKDRTEVLEALTSSIVKGNVESLNSLDLGVSAERIWAAYSARIHGTVQELTTAEKRQAAWNYILDQGRKFQGAYAATAGTLAYELDYLKAAVDDVRLSFGRFVNRELAQLAARVTPLLTKIAELPPEFKAVAARVLVFGGALLSLGGILAVLTPIIQPLQAVLALTGDVIRGLASKIVVLAGKFNALGLVAAALAAVFITDFGGVRSAIERLIGGWDNALAAARAVFVGLAATVTLLARLIQNTVGRLFGWLDRTIREQTDKIQANNFGMDFQGAVRNFFVGGAAIAGAFVAGLIRGLAGAVRAVRTHLQGISRNLVGQSPPPEGPLKDVDLGGYRIIEAWVGGMLSYPVEQVEQLAERVEQSLRRALWPIQDALFALDTRDFQLDKALWPLEDALRRIEAAADLVTIPLERQRRALQHQRDELAELLELEEKRLEAQLEALERQEQALKRQVELARERLDLVEHELFIENVKNKIRKQETSALALILRSRKMEVEDALAEKQAELDALRAALDARREEADLAKELHEAQLAAIDKQLAAIDKLIAVEEERVQYAREELELAEARQVGERLAIEAERRILQEQERQLQHMLDVVGRVNDLLEKGKEAVDEWGDLVGDALPGEFKLPELDFGALFGDIDQLADDMVAAFMAPLEAALEELTEEWDLLTASWSDLKVTVQVTFQRKGLGETIRDFFAASGKEAKRQAAEVSDDYQSLFGDPDRWDPFVDTQVEPAIAAWVHRQIDTAVTRYWEGKVRLDEIAKDWETFWDNFNAFFGGSAPAAEGQEPRQMTAAEVWLANQVAAWERRKEDTRQFWTQAGEDISAWFAEGVAAPIDAYVAGVEARWELLKLSATALWAAIRTAVAAEIEALKAGALAKFEELKAGAILRAVGLYKGALAWLQLLKALGVAKVEGLRAEAVAKVEELRDKATQAFEDAKAWIIEKLDALLAYWTETLYPALEDVYAKITAGPVQAFKDVKGAIEALEDPISRAKRWIQGLIDKLEKVKVPNALKEKSPSPMARSVMHLTAELVGANAALSQTAQLMRTVGQAASPLRAGGWGGATVPARGAPGRATTINYNTITHEGPRIDFSASYARAQSASSVRSDLQLIAGLL